MADESNQMLETAVIGMDRIDLSHLVGKYISLFSSQYPGQTLRTKVLSIRDLRIQINAGGEADRVAQLVNRQGVVVQFLYKGQDISVRAQLDRSEGGRCNLDLMDKATPLSRRKFRRVNEPVAAKVAALPGTAFTRETLKRLRWMETQTVDLSSSGVQLSLPGVLERDNRMLLNLELAVDLLPALVLGRVRHWFQAEDNRYRIGVEFIVREMVKRLFPPSTVGQIPQVALGYSAQDREKLNKEIVAGAKLKEPAG